jgi:uncharacterized membrane protein
MSEGDTLPPPTQPKAYEDAILAEEERACLPTFERICMKLFMLCGIVEVKFANMITSPKSERKFRFLIFLTALMMVSLAWTIFLVEFFIRQPSIKMVYLFLPGIFGTVIYFFTFINTMKYIKYAVNKGSPYGYVHDQPTHDPEFVYLWIIVVNMIPMIMAFIIAFIDHHNGVAETSSYAAALQTGMIFFANVVSMFPYYGCASSPHKTDDDYP